MAIAAPPAPAPTSTAPAKRPTNPAIPPAPVRASAAATPTPAATETPAEPEPEEPSIDPVDLAVFLRQTVLLVSACAAVLSAAAARYGQRTWLMAVMCAAIAAIVTGMLGMALARSFAAQCLVKQNETK